MSVTPAGAMTSSHFGPLTRGRVPAPDELPESMREALR